jgi:HEXXH motif-containing protein
MTHIRGSGDELCSYLQNTIYAELAFSGTTQIQKPVWMCDGSRLIDKRSNATFDEEGWRLGGRYEAATVFNGIPLDHHSPFARRPMPVAEFRSIHYGRPRPFTAQEEATAVEKVKDAAALISQFAPHNADFIGRYVKTIVLRKSEEEHGAFQSASRNSFIGQVVLLNAHLSHVDLAYVAESLVHESIHSVLWRAEILDQLLIDPQKDMYTVRSAWSGEEIYYYTLLQACLVWYGIFWFWRNLRSTQAPIPEERMLYLQERARRGFLKREYEQALRSHCDNLAEGILEMLLHLRDVVRTS